MWSTRAVIALVPVVALSLVATRYRRSWYFYDEWSLLYRLITQKSIRGTFEVFNGHLYAFPSLAYRAQLGLGLEGHAFVWTVFCVTLLVCNLSIARFLWVAGVPAIAATVAGTAVTYFGPGAQLMTLEFQFGTVGAIAVSFLAACIALRNRSSFGRAVAIGVLLLVAVGFDSGAAFAGLVFVGALLALRWRDRWALVALGPALAAGVAILVVARTSPRSPAGLGSELALGVHLVLLAAGGLVGGGQIAGAIVIAVACAVFAPAIASGHMSGPARHCLVAGTLAALAMSGIIARTRAGLVGHDFFDFNRYIATVAFFVLAALLPAAVSVARDLTGRRAVWIGPVVAAVFTVAFLLNLTPMLRYRRVVEGWQTQTHVLVAQVSEQLARGCPNGVSPPENAQPLGTLGPQVTVALLRQLEARGSLQFASRTATPVSASVRDALCRP